MNPGLRSGSAAGSGLALVRVAGARCTGCGACFATCPEHALRPGPLQPGGGRPPMVLADACTGCAECVEICPSDAIEEVDQ
ncbi:MAG: ATP-binding protein [Frankia sp.]